jgi:uncharacterized protein (UPF0276 family)
MTSSITGVGLGFRAALAEPLLAAPSSRARFVEVAPENYLGVGGQRGRWLAMAKERWPIVCHGLCGDFAGTAPLDREFLGELKTFLRACGAQWFSDHLCLTHVTGREVHDLLPLPFTRAAASQAARRIRELRDILELPLAIENVSAYLRAPGGELDEAAFVTAVAEEADCGVLLDVNNVYVNSVNFKLDARAIIDAMPLARVVQIHVAGHDVEIPNELLVDTHGSPIIDPVYDLLDYTLRALARKNVRPPVLLERDHNIPPLADLEAELARLTEVRDAVG